MMKPHKNEMSELIFVINSLISFLSYIEYFVTVFFSYK